MRNISALIKPEPDLRIVAPPPGYVAFCGTIQPGSQVRDYAARGQVIKGYCRMKRCNRRVELDPQTLCNEGMALLDMSKLKPLWACSRVDGCALTWENEPPRVKLVLQQFIGVKEARIRLTCRTHQCEHARVFRAEAIIKGLLERKTGNDLTQVSELPSKTTAVCRRCGKADWAVDVLWADTATVGWRQDGEKIFKRYEVG